MSRALEVNQSIGLGELLPKIPRHLLSSPFPSETDFWTVDGIDCPPGSFDSYEMSFAPFLQGLGESTFQDYLGERKQQGNTTDALDLFGGGYFIRDVTTMDSMTAVRLKNIDEQIKIRLQNALASEVGALRQEQFAEDLSFLGVLTESGKREVVEGNLFRLGTWNKVRDSALLRRINGFDLVVCRPDGAFSSADESTDQNIMTVEDQRAGNTLPYKFLFLSMFNQAYSLLREGGVLCTEIPQIVFEQDDLHRFQEATRKFSEVTIEVGENYVGNSILMVKKRKGAPEPLTSFGLLKIREQLLPKNLDLLAA